MMATPPAAARTEMPPHMWRACGGPSARAPHVGSLVYYFPEGHLEQCASVPSDLPLTHLHRPFFLCTVTSVHLLADPYSDEVYSIISLDPTASSPINGYYFATSPPQTQTHQCACFSKVLTQSDANNGGGFSVPRFCADSIFPPLDLGNDPPVQTLTMRDVHGKSFEFRHIYRGTPRRHLLTTGWSRFVNDKKLVAGDTVVFIRNGTNLHIGIRRGPCYVRSMVTAEEVLDAVEAAAAGRSFQVVYYPRSGDTTGLFVVEKETVERALMAGYWSTGVRVKLAIEVADSVHTAMYQGTLAKVLSKPSPWLGSPWRALQVIWDDPEMLQSAQYVCPWNVKMTSPNPLHDTIETPYTTRPLKRVRGASCNIYQHSPETCEMTSTTPLLHFTQAPYTTPSLEQFPTASYAVYEQFTEEFKPEPILPFMLNQSTTIPAGMQGARHHYHHLPSVYTPGPSTHLTPYQVLSENPLEGSSETGTDQSRSSGKNVATGTIMLFGKLIEFEQDSDEGVNEAGDEFFLPDFVEQNLDASIGTHTCYFTDLVLQSEGA
ncbi:Auxin response factor [Rhynchospora pubera]|uniref:Auxin response factor n=1 Tax=Rhynchospora pubera TaxID=906938 RepID=A0AAV8F4G6_9POAL|nr:Auxin response factor [Rhynchospora pubera]